jgi:hypothetical protein
MRSLATLADLYNSLISLLRNFKLTTVTIPNPQGTISGMASSPVALNSAHSHSPKQAFPSTHSLRLTAFSPLVRATSLAHLRIALHSTPLNPFGLPLPTANVPKTGNASNYRVCLARSH